MSLLGARNIYRNMWEVSRSPMIPSTSFVFPLSSSLLLFFRILSPFKSFIFFVRCRIIQIIHITIYFTSAKSAVCSFLRRISLLLMVRFRQKRNDLLEGFGFPWQLLGLWMICWPFVIYFCFSLQILDPTERSTTFGPLPSTRQWIYRFPPSSCSLSSPLSFLLSLYSVCISFDHSSSPLFFRTRAFRYLFVSLTSSLLLRMFTNLPLQVFFSPLSLCLFWNVIMTLSPDFACDYVVYTFQFARWKEEERRCYFV